jgi:hypothetical protein
VGEHRGEDQLAGLRACLAWDVGHPAHGDVAVVLGVGTAGFESANTSSGDNPRRGWSCVPEVDLAVAHVLLGQVRDRLASTPSEVVLVAENTETSAVDVDGVQEGAEGVPVNGRTGARARRGRGACFRSRPPVRDLNSVVRRWVE